MNYAEIKYFDVANGPGVRTSLFVSGCTHGCKGCFNEIAQNFNYGKPFTREVEYEIISTLRSGLTLLGGEPFEIENLKALVPFIIRVREAKPDISIWAYSGYTLEQLHERKGQDLDLTMAILMEIDILVDGKFIEELKDIRLQFRGSSNQRIIDVKKSNSKIEIWDKLRN